MARRLRQAVTALMAAAGCAFPLAGSEAASFGAGVDNSQWYLSESVFACSLSHDVPGYGRAVFRRRAGEAVGFYLETNGALFKPGTGRLVVEAPVWRPGVAPRPLGSVQVGDGPRPVAVDSRKTMQMVQGLLDGLQPTIIRTAWYSQEPVRVQVSNINFAQAFQKYQACTANLLPVNYDQIQRTRIGFASGSTSLSDGDRRRLDNIATFVLADSTIEHVFVDGHSDRIGSRITNRALSEERANVVADYLKARGVPENLLIVRAHGDQYPVSRRPADNRRTNIRLQRQGEVPALQQASGYGGDSAG